MGKITAFLTTICKGYVLTLLHDYITFAALHSPPATPRDTTAFTELLRDSEEMGSEKQTKLSKIIMHVLLFSGNTHL